jgi:hypothetical protein
MASFSSISSGDGRGRVTRSRASCHAEGSSGRQLKSIRLMKYCQDLELPRDLECSGCCYYEDAPAKTRVDLLREVSHSGKKFQCAKPWKADPTKPGYYDNGGGHSWYLKIQDFLLNQGYSSNALEVAITPAVSFACSTKSQLSDWRNLVLLRRQQH